MLSGNSFRQTVHTHCVCVHQPVKFVAALLRVAKVTAGLAENNGSLLPGLWLSHLLTAKNRYQFRNLMLGNQVWATFTFFYYLHKFKLLAYTEILLRCLLHMSKYLVLQAWCPYCHTTNSFKAQKAYTYKSPMPSVLWRCWLGSRKGIRLVKNWVVGCWHGYLSGARCRLAYGPADSNHCLLLQ